MPEERGLYPRMKVGEQLVYLARAARPVAGRGEGVGRTGGWSGSAWPRGATTRCRSSAWATSSGSSSRRRSCTNRAILVLDEPFSGLDPVAVDVMSQVLREKAAEGIPVVFSSHQLDLVERLCDRVGIIRSGQMVAVGPVDELRAGGAVQLVVDAPGAPPGWAAGLAGVRVLSRERCRDGARARRRRRRPGGAAGRAGDRAGARVRPAAAVADRAVPARRDARRRSRRE